MRERVRTNNRHRLHAAAQSRAFGDNRVIGSGGGIKKWTFYGTTWTLATTFTNCFSSGVVGLAGEAVGANTVLNAIKKETSY